MSKKTKIILIVSVCALVVAAVAITGVMHWKTVLARRERTTIVGFYDIDAKQQKAVQDVIERAYAAQHPEGIVLSEDAATDELPDDILVLKFITLTDKEAADTKLTEDVDLLITQTGALTSSLMTKSAAEPAEIKSRFPRTLQSSPYFSLDGQMVVMPLFLDHFEISYYNILTKELSAELPVSLTEFAEYAESIRENIVYPFIASGADETVLFSMISAFVESVAGADGYRDLVKEVSEIGTRGYPFDRVLELPLKGDAPAGLVFGDILQVLRNWRNSGLMLGDWYETKEGTLRVFMEDYHTGIIGMMLSQHRRMPYPMIKYYESTQFPADTSMNRALIAPSVSCMLFTGKDSVRAFADALSSADEQENLSVATQLAPATLRGQSFDIQADDVRFLAATNEGGPVPELGRAAFASPEKRTEFADWLRKQLK